MHNSKYNIVPKAVTYLHDFKHLWPCYGSIFVFIIEFEGPAKLLHRRTLDQHTDGCHILSEVYNSILIDDTTCYRPTHSKTTKYINKYCWIFVTWQFWQMFYKDVFPNIMH